MSENMIPWSDFAVDVPIVLGSALDAPYVAPGVHHGDHPVSRQKTQAGPFLHSPFDHQDLGRVETPVILWIIDNVMRGSKARRHGGETRWSRARDLMQRRSS